MFAAWDDQTARALATRLNIVVGRYAQLKQECAAALAARSSSDLSKIRGRLRNFDRTTEELRKELREGLDPGLAGEADLASWPLVVSVVHSALVEIRADAEAACRD